MLRLSYRTNFWYSHSKLQLQKVALFRLGYYILMISQTVSRCGATVPGICWLDMLEHTHFGSVIF